MLLSFRDAHMPRMPESFSSVCGIRIYSETPACEKTCAPAGKRESLGSITWPCSNAHAKLPDLQGRCGRHSFGKCHGSSGSLHRRSSIGAMESHGAEWHSTFQRTMCMPQPRLHAVNPRHPGLRSGMSRTRHQQHPLILDELRLDQSWDRQCVHKAKAFALSFTERVASALF